MLCVHCGVGSIGREHRGLPIEILVYKYGVAYTHREFYEEAGGNGSLSSMSTELE